MMARRYHPVFNNCQTFATNLLGLICDNREYMLTAIDLVAYCRLEARAEKSHWAEGDLHVVQGGEDGVMLPTRRAPLDVLASQARAAAAWWDRFLPQASVIVDIR
jgi:hypothetical protein